MSCQKMRRRLDVHQDQSRGMRREDLRGCMLVMSMADSYRSHELRDSSIERLAKDHKLSESRMCFRCEEGVLFKAQMRRELIDEFRGDAQKYKKMLSFSKILEEQGHETVRVTIKYPQEFVFETELCLICWYIYRLHADSLIHLISNGFRNWLKENIVVEPLKDSIIETLLTHKSKLNMIDDIYLMISTNCEVCRQHRKVAGYGKSYQYGEILRQHMDKQILFSDVMFLPACRRSRKGLLGLRMVVLMASMKKNSITGVVQGNIGARVIEDKESLTVLKEISDFVDSTRKIPDLIWLDKGTEYINEPLMQYAGERSIPFNHTGTGSSESNGAIERIVGLLRQALRSIAGERGISFREVHDFVDLAIERVNANYFISKVGSSWSRDYWVKCPRLVALNEMVEMAKFQMNKEQNEQGGELLAQSVVFWKPPTLEKNQPAIKVRVVGKARFGGSNAYFVEQVDKGRVEGISSISLTHLALRRDLSNIVDDVRQQVDRSIKKISLYSKGCQTESMTVDESCQITTDEFEREIDVDASHVRSWTSIETQTQDSDVIIQEGVKELAMNGGENVVQVDNDTLIIISQEERMDELDENKDVLSNEEVKESIDAPQNHSCTQSEQPEDHKNTESFNNNTVSSFLEGNEDSGLLNNEDKDSSSISDRKDETQQKDDRGERINIELKKLELLRKITEIQTKLLNKSSRPKLEDLEKMITELKDCRRQLDLFNQGRIQVVKMAKRGESNKNQGNSKYKSLGYFGLMQRVQKLMNNLELLVEEKKNEKVLNKPQGSCFQGHVRLIMHKRSKRSKRGGKKLEILPTIWEDSQDAQGHVMSMKMKMDTSLSEGCVSNSGMFSSSTPKPEAFDELQKMLGIIIRKGPLTGVLRSANHKVRSDLYLIDWSDKSSTYFSSKELKKILKEKIFDKNREDLLWKCNLARLNHNNLVRVNDSSKLKMTQRYQSCIKRDWNLYRKKKMKKINKGVQKGTVIPIRIGMKKSYKVFFKDEESKVNCGRCRFKRVTRYSRLRIPMRGWVKNQDLGGHSIEVGDWVVFSEDRQSSLWHKKELSQIGFGKVVKVIRNIEKVRYEGVDNKRIIEKKEALENPVVIIHKCSNVSLFREPVELARFFNIRSFRRQWLVKSFMGHWEKTLSLESPSIMAKPICEALVMSHVMKITGKESQLQGLERGEYDFNWMNYQKGQFHIRRLNRLRRSIRWINSDMFVTRQGRLNVLKNRHESENGHKLVSEVITSDSLKYLEVGKENEILIDEDIFADQIFPRKDKLEAHEEFRLQQILKGVNDDVKTSRLESLWNSLCSQGVYELSKDGENEETIGVVRKFMKLNKDRNLVFQETELMIDKEVGYELQEPKDKWVSKSEYSGRYDQGKLLKSLSSDYEFHIDEDIRKLLSHQAVFGEDKKEEDKKSEEIDDSKKGVIGLDKKIVLTGLDPDDPLHKMVRAAKMKEWMSFKKQGVLKPVTRNEFESARRKDYSAACLPMRWVLEWKIIDGEKNIKARLVAQGTVRKDRREGVLTEVALPNHRALYTMLMWQVKQKSWNPKTSILQGDLKTAFLQAENLSEVVFVTKPKDDGASSEEDRLLIDSMFSKERVPMARAVMTLYGTRDAPANLDMAVRKSLHNKGFKETLTCPNLYRRFTAIGVKYSDLMKMSEKDQLEALSKGRELDAWVFAYVDDLLMGSGLTSAMEVSKELQERWVFKEVPTPPSRFLGIFIKATERGVFVDQELLASSLKRVISPYVWRNHESLLLPLPREPDSIEKAHYEDLLRGNELKGRKHTKYRSLLGIISYLAHTRPDLMFTISFFSQFGSQPSATALKHLQIACSYAAKTATYGISFLTDSSRGEMLGDFSRIKPSEPKTDDKVYLDAWGKVKPRPPPKKREEEPEKGEFHIEVFVDASYKSGGGKAHSGYLILVNRMVVATKATVQRRKAGSSTRAELLALMEAMDGCLAVKLLLMEIGISAQSISVVVWCDNDNTVMNVNSVNPHATEFHSTFLLRQCYRILKGGAQLDVMRILFPRFMFVMEGHLHDDEFLVFDVGDGALGRYRRPDEMMRALQMFTKNNKGHEVINDKDLALYQIIFERMGDSEIRLLHIDGANQLADSMTKMAVSIDLVGRVVQDYKDFLLGKRTGIRDEGCHVSYREAGHRERYSLKDEKNDGDEIPIEFEDLTGLPEDLTSEQFMALIKKEET